MFNEQMKKLGEERSVIREIFEYGNERAKRIGRENVFDFSLGNPNVPAPDCVREGIARLLAETPAEVLHGYTSAAGAPDVRAAVAEYIREAFGTESSAELIYMTCGAAASLTIALNALCESGDEFVVITPCFPEYRVFVERAGGKLVEARANETFHLDLAVLDRAVGARTKAVIVNSPNNPTGAVYGEAELKALSALLERKSAERGTPVFLISDEPYRELVYGAAVPYLPKYYKNTVVCYSFSKSLSLAGERIGYIAVHPACTGAGELFAAVCGAGRSLGYVCAPSLFQRVCAECLGKSSDVNAYRENRDLLYGALVSYGFECALPEGAFYLFMKSPEADAKAFCERAKKYELLLVPSDSFGTEGYVRISYCVSRDTIVRALPAFERLAGEYGLRV
ncbi:MAG: pyridoxal phosphate-dependent aminotransferase [Clostridia bacterium]|nr:pyridoxal phosphate-dependent aminotransferase [Clostridia bacterium]